MKNWVFLGLLAVAGYWMYSSWFASDESDGEGEKKSGSPLEIVSDDKTAGDDTADDRGARDAATSDKRAAAAPGRKSVSLDLGGGSDDPGAEPDAKAAAPDPSWKLHEQRLKAVEDKDKKKADALRRRILREFPDTDAARWIHFERGREALAAYRKLKWKKEGLQKAQEARKALTPALFLSRADPAEKEALREILAELAQVVLFSGKHVEGADFSYTPKRGDNLSTLCRKVFRARGTLVSPGFVAAVNGLRGPQRPAGPRTDPGADRAARDRGGQVRVPPVLPVRRRLRAGLPGRPRQGRQHPGGDVHGRRQAEKPRLVPARRRSHQVRRPAQHPRDPLARIQEHEQLPRFRHPRYDGALLDRQAGLVRLCPDAARRRRARLRLDAEGHERPDPSVA